MKQILNSNEQPTCQKCIYSNAELLCRYDKSAPVQKNVDEFCSDGKWMVKYRKYVQHRGKLIPKYQPKIYCCQMSGILTDRLRYEMLRKT
jgi:hypothetical protein